MLSFMCILFDKYYRPTYCCSSAAHNSVQWHICSVWSQYSIQHDIVFKCHKNTIIMIREMTKTYVVYLSKTIKCNIVTISSSTIRMRRITTFNASFQGFISVWRKINISVTRVTLPYQLMFEIIPWQNKLDNTFSLLQHS